MNHFPAREVRLVGSDLFFKWIWNGIPRSVRFDNNGGHSTEEIYSGIELKRNTSVVYCENGKAKYSLGLTGDISYPNPRECLMCEGVTGFVYNNSFYDPVKKVPSKI